MRIRTNLNPTAFAKEKTPDAALLMTLTSEQLVLIILQIFS
jgi:hypothetical protein